MTAVHANTDAFDGFSWHDNQVHGLRWELGDPERGEWHHRLVLDIDHIVEWTGAGIGEGRFRVAPASLVFEDVQDLKLVGQSPQLVELDGLKPGSDFAELMNSWQKRGPNKWLFGLCWRVWNRSLSSFSIRSIQNCWSRLGGAPEIMGAIPSRTSNRRARAFHLTKPP